MNWSLENEIDLVWGVKTGKNDNIDNLFDKKFQKTLNFASWSSDESINKMLRNGLSNVEAIDSDIDSSLHLS